MTIFLKMYAHLEIVSLEISASALTLSQRFLVREALYVARKRNQIGYNGRIAGLVGKHPLHNSLL